MFNCFAGSGYLIIFCVLSIYLGIFEGGINLVVESISFRKTYFTFLNISVSVLILSVASKIAAFT